MWIVTSIRNCETLTLWVWTNIDHIMIVWFSFIFSMSIINDFAILFSQNIPLLLLLQYFSLVHIAGTSARCGLLLQMSQHSLRVSHSGGTLCSRMCLLCLSFGGRRTVWVLLTPPPPKKNLNFGDRWHVLAACRSRLNVNVNVNVNSEFI